MLVFKQPFFPLPSNSKSKLPEVSRTDSKKEFFKFTSDCWQSFICFYTPILPSVHLSTYPLPIHPPIYSFIHSPTHPVIHCFICSPSTSHLLICLPKHHLSNYHVPTIHLLICLSICLLIYPPIQALNHLPIHLPFTHLPSIHLTAPSTSASLSIYLINYLFLLIHRPFIHLLNY